MAVVHHFVTAPETVLYRKQSPNSHRHSDCALIIVHLQNQLNTTSLFHDMSSSMTKLSLNVTVASRRVKKQHDPEVAYIDWHDNTLKWCLCKIWLTTFVTRIKLSLSIIVMPSNLSDICKTRLEVIKLEFILKLKIKPDRWLLADTYFQTQNKAQWLAACWHNKQPIIGLYFETVLKFFNLRASIWKE